jgi:hypothetical protein
MSTPSPRSAPPLARWLAALLLAGLGASGCAQGDAPSGPLYRKVVMTPPEPTSLTLTGLTPQPLPGSILSVKLLSVNDGRCPQDAQCLWAGMATVIAQVSQPGSPPVQLRLFSGSPPPGHAEPEQRWAFGLGFSVSSLLPRPLSGKTVAPADWRVKLDVAREDMPR